MAKKSKIAADKLAETLIGGILREQEASGDLPKFDLFPVPNLFFSRDPQVVIGNGVVISSMATLRRKCPPSFASAV